MRRWYAWTLMFRSSVVIHPQHRIEIRILDHRIGPRGILGVHIGRLSAHAKSAKGPREVGANHVDAVMDQQRLSRAERASDREEVQTIIVTDRPVDRAP